MKLNSIKNLSLYEMEKLFISQNIDPSRSKELFTWLYERNCGSFDDITVFPKTFRNYLSGNFLLKTLELISTETSSDGTVKILLQTADCQLIESVLIPNRQKTRVRYTACISSQAGCAMGCTFCSTASAGFRRNLSTSEILDQLSHLRKISGIKNTNIVFMGMGEPFNNYENVMKAAEIMNYSFGLHISAYKITVSTCGILEGIKKFVCEKRPFNLAISLNDSDFSKRSANMPVERKHPFSEIMSFLRENPPASKNRILLEYVMRADNISGEDARRLKEIITDSDVVLNCISLNGGSHNFELPDECSIKNFLAALDLLNVHYTVRESYGKDINAACGQLAAGYGKLR